MVTEHYWTCNLCEEDGFGDTRLVLHFKIMHPAHWAICRDDVDPRKPWLN